MLTHKLTQVDDLADFSCGVAELDTYLKRFALLGNRIDDAMTYVTCSQSGAVVGFYTLVVGSVMYAGAPDRVRKGLPRHPVPVMVLARLAVDSRFQGQAIGSRLVLDALVRTMQAADIAGIRAVLVHAKNDRLAGWYKAMGFEEGPEPRTLFLLMKDVRRAAREAGVGLPMQTRDP